ncbi:hypothetical protein P7C73_g2195, partial [Tremellales sp. Uapishka_1]
MKKTMGPITVIDTKPARLAQQPYTRWDGNQATYLVFPVFAAFLLGILAILSTPIIPGVTIANIKTESSGSISFGAWGWCASGYPNLTASIDDIIAGANTSSPQPLESQCSSHRAFGGSMDAQIDQLPPALKDLMIITKEIPASYLIGSGIMHLLAASGSWQKKEVNAYGWTRWAFAGTLWSSLFILIAWALDIAEFTRIQKIDISPMPKVTPGATIWMMMGSFILCLATFIFRVSYLKFKPRPLWTIKGAGGDFNSMPGPMSAALPPAEELPPTWESLNLNSSTANGFPMDAKEKEEQEEERDLLIAICLPDGVDTLQCTLTIARKVGSWLPLPHIYSGFAVHPFHPTSSLPNPSTSPLLAKTPNKNRFSWSGVNEKKLDSMAEDGKRNPYEISLDVGDEFFAFEEYRCAAEGQAKGEVWYRGYVVQAVSLALLTPAASPHASQLAYPRPEPSVLIGIFPATVVHIRPGAPNDSGALEVVYEKARLLAEEKYHAGTGKIREMEAVTEEEDEGEIGHDASSPSRSPPGKSVMDRPRGSSLQEVVDIPPSPSPILAVNGLARPNRPKSLLLEAPIATSSQEAEKDQPPLPKLTAGDSTTAGAQWPLVDEIACAIREWYGRLPTYLANRDYRLFNAVIQHIDALFLGRRQLLSQTLSGDELKRVRKECVSRLVKCNVAQGLEVIVRSLEDGSVMVVDKERAASGASWIGGITCYVYQVQSFQNFSLESAKSDHAATPPSGSYYHCCLDVRAFIASPCNPGETAELYFSLYSRSEGRFVTEEFCLVMNHLGSPARDPEQRLGRLRTLFTDLKAEDISDTVYLVCRLVRNGAMKMSSVASSAGASDAIRRVSLGPRRASGNLLAEQSEGTWRGSTSHLDTMTDDSFSVTSGVGNRRSIVETVNTTQTTTGRSTFRRPLGCAVLELNKLSRMVGETSDNLVQTGEFTMPIFVPREEGTFASLHEDIIHGRMKEFERSSRAEAIAVSVKVFKGVAAQVIKEHPSLLQDIPISARLGFPDVVYPGTMRNDLYIKLWCASFTSMPVSTSGSLRMRKAVTPHNQGNVQITLEVRNTDGNVVPDAIYAGGSGEPPMSQYHSLVFYHNDRPTYGELIKISPPAQAGNCHLFLVFRSRSKEKTSQGIDSSELEKPFAFAYLPLFSTRNCIKDGLHDLVLYRMEKNLQPTPNVYLEAPPISDTEPRLPATTSKSMTPLKDRMSVRSYLCSSLHSQDDTLRALFNWQQHLSDIDSLSSILQLFGFVSEEEIGKFVPTVLDALFGILVSNVGDVREEVNDLVFQCLVKVLAMTSDRRFPNFHAVLDLYIDQHFNFPASSFRLLRSMKSVMGTPDDKGYRAFLKVWHLFFRFIIRSRELERSRGIGLDTTSAHIEADFRRQTKGILGELNALMNSHDKTLIGTQTLAVQHYSDILPDLARVFPPIEITEMVIAFADTLISAKGSLAIYKLLLLLQVVKNIFDSSESRALLVPAMVRWVKPHLGSHEEEFSGKLGEGQGAADVIAWTVNKLQEWLVSPLTQEDDFLRIQEEENLEYCLSLLPSPQSAEVLSRHQSSATVWKSTPDVFPMSHPFALVASLPPASLLYQHQHPNDDGLPSADQFRCGSAEAAVVILTLILACPRHNLDRWFEESIEVDGVSGTSDILKSIFAFFKSVVRFEPFPRQWLTLSLMSFSVIIKTMTAVAQVMYREAFIPPIKDSTSFDAALWRSCFELLCDVCGSNELALEEQSEQRRRAEWIIAGDLRDEGAGLLLGLWNAIGWPLDGAHSDGLRYGGYQTRFTGLADRILGLCLSSHDQMCETAVEILFSMIYAEYVLEGNFDSIETEIFGQLDILVDTAFHLKVGNLLDEVELFIDLLLVLRDLPETPEWKDERAAATYRLMIFIMKIGRKDLYIRFVHQLVDINVESSDWLAAGLALKLHADLYDWSLDGDLVESTKIGKVELPAQNQFARKEAIYYLVLDYLGQAEAYEIALEICHELTVEHQKVTYNHERLVDLFSHQAKLWERIGETSRPQPEYYRLVSGLLGTPRLTKQAFYGAFPSIIKDKEFIARGQPWQKYSEICESVQHKHPTATLYRSMVPPSEATRLSDESTIWITSVDPEPDMALPVFKDTVSDNVQAHWKHNRVNNFSGQRPFYIDGDMDSLTDLWVEKTILTTANTMPFILSRSEVVETKIKRISPIQKAITEIQKATAHLVALGKRYQAGIRPENADTRQLAMALNSAVDSPVHGGVPLYRKTFLDPDYIEIHPQETKNVGLLRESILQYAEVIRVGLRIHRRFVKPDMSAFHEALERFFAKTFPDEISMLPRASVSSLAVDENGFTSPKPLPSIQYSLHDSLSSSPQPSVQSTPYTLPPLKLHPGTFDTSLTNLRRAPSVPGTAASSPRHSESINSGNLISPRKQSGSVRSGAGNGTGEVVSVSGKKQKGLKRFGSLLRRIN